MSDSNLLADLLGQTDIETARKIGSVIDVARGNAGGSDAYDLTNPNLHHGTGSGDAPGIPFVEQSGSISPDPLGALSPAPAVSESFHIAVGDAGPTATAIADQHGNEGQAFSFDVSSHFAVPAAGDTLTYAAALPAGLSIDAHTGVISGTPTDADFGTHPVTVTATDAHGQAVSESFHLAVGDTGQDNNGDNNQPNGDNGQTSQNDNNQSNGDNGQSANDGNGQSSNEQNGQSSSDNAQSNSQSSGDSGHASTGDSGQSGSQSNGDNGQPAINSNAQSNSDNGQNQGATHGYSMTGDSNGNDTYFIDSHSGAIAIHGNAGWTDAVDLHSAGQNASFDVSVFDANGHTVQNWTGLVTDGSGHSDHDLTLAQGDHATITINHTDGSATDHIALQNVDHLKY